jgi:hypothetical protein
MKLSNDLVNVLSKVYEPQVMVNRVFKGKDMSFKTDDKGNPVLLFIGKAGDKGQIKGERYARTLKYDNEGKAIKDHWELKGKAT